MVHPSSADAPDPAGRGAFGTVFLLVGYAIVLVAVISAANVAFDLNLALGARGASATALPTNWESVIMLAAVGGLIVGLVYFGSGVKRALAGSKGPAGRIVVVVGALVFLGVVGRGLQILALTSTYGSMFVYDCTDAGDIEDVRDALEDGVTDEELERCMVRTAQWDRHDLLADLVAAGADFDQQSNGVQSKRCLLTHHGVSFEYVRTAVELGATPQTCPNAEELIETVVRGAKSGDDVDAMVELLTDAGWQRDPAS